MQVNEVPEPWASAMVAKDFTHGKRPSIRALSRAAGVGSAETVRQMIYAGRVSDTDTVDKVAAALGKSPVEVSQWINQERTVRKPYSLPGEIALLTEAEQDAVSNLIKAIAKGRRPARKAPSNVTPLRRSAAETHQDRPVPTAAMEPERRGQPRERELPGQNTDPYIDGP